MPRLGRRFYRRDPVTLARDLLGRVLVRVTDDGTRLAGRIVEVEAYLGIPDAAAHTFRGHRSPRNNAMYLDGGTAYVYFTYGMHYCLNVVAQTAGQPTACLIRALEPVEGLETMRTNRARATKDTHLCSGPAKLTQAMAIDRAFDGVDLVTSDRLFIERGKPIGPRRTVVAKRIGVAYAGRWAHKTLRFYERDNPHVSRR